MTMTSNNAGNAARKMPIPLQVVDTSEPDELEEETFIVIGEAGDDLAFEVCEDIDIALGVREAMIEDGFKVKMYQATEIEVVDDDSPISARKN
jgi:hypothetical protein